MPTGLAGAPRNGAVVLGWTKPTSDGGLPIADYVVQYRPNVGGSQWTTFPDDTSTRTSATVTGLTNGVTYYVRVRAKNVAGNFPPTQAGPVVPFVQAAAPTGLTGSVGSGRANLSWTAGTSPKPITGYVIQFRPF
jgi:titin